MLERQHRVGMGARIGLMLCVLAIDGAFFINLCDWIYRCGCASLWNGAAEMCNVHASSPPHCPWCRHTWAGAVVFLSTVAAQGALVLPSKGLSFVARSVTALLAFVVVGGAVGFLIGIATGYWS